MTSFAERLRILRNENNLTMKQLGEKLDLTEQAISMYERGERTPNYEKLESIADYFNVDMDYLMGRSTIKNAYREGLIKSEIFTNAEEAIKFILELPLVANYGGYDLESMSEEEVIEFANDVSEMIKMLGKKHK
ncbi:MAG: helix-turn-helix transcriptional regulator [Erysipelotrichaceae bacterium]|nr:helix-turn-helix transcriptional regulator [Erysipelotrichaceae bacterium]